MNSFLQPFSLLLIQEGLLSVTSGIYVRKILVNRLVKLAEEKVWLGELNVLTLL